MKTTRQLFYGGVAFAFGASLLLAQGDPSGQRPLDQRSFANELAQENRDNFVRPRPGHRPPPIPLVLAIDQNRDRVIDATEIANAAAALQQLDKNHDGILSTEEFLPPPPPQHRDGTHGGGPGCPAPNEQDQP